MAFIQIVEFETSNLEEVLAVGQEWSKAVEGKSTARRVFVTQDRDDPKRIRTIVLFDSYESAMENSNLPETQEYSQRMMAVAGGAPTFHNLDVLEEQP